MYNPHKVQVYATGKKPAYSSGYSNDKPAYGAKSYGGGKSYGAPRAAYPKPIGSTPSVKPMMNSAPAPVAAKSAAPAMKPAAAHAPKAAKPAMHVAKPAAAQAAKPAAGSPTWKTKAKKKTGLGWDKPLTRT